MVPGYEMFLVNEGFLGEKSCLLVEKYPKELQSGVESKENDKDRYRDVLPKTRQKG
jgi:hypothetical protein